MKKTMKSFVLAALCILTTLFASCQREQLDTAQFSDRNVTLAAVEPNPVMRGGVLRLVGSNLDRVTEVHFAGNVTVTSIEKIATGPRSEIRVTVPLEGPEVGPVTVVANDGTVLNTRFDLEYTEPISIDSFSPAEALSGDVITIKGEYLNNVSEVIFGGEVYVTEFLSQSRGELQVQLPSNAVSGFVILGDVNELEDKTTIPNQIYSAEELVVGAPTVTEAEPATYKAGDRIVIQGAHLDMIASLALTGADEVEFTISEDGSEISFNLPATATDGPMLLTSYAGMTFQAGQIETVSVTDLTIASQAEDGRYKAGNTVKLSGNDLDLVTKVDFTGAEASWYYMDGSVYATVPAAAQDGGVGVTLASGKQVWTEPIEVVKPWVESYNYGAVIAGQTEVTISGYDLDLVTSAKWGTKAQGFIDCEFRFGTDDEGQLAIVVSTPRQAYTGPVTLTSAAGYEASTGEIVVEYEEAVSITFDQESYALGKNITISGSNLLQVETIRVKGQKVTSYALRSDQAMSFALPEGVTSPGVYRLELTLLDGSELTWPVPFEVTAPYTETFIWEGYEDLAGWGNSPYFGAEDAFITAGLQAGDLVRVYYQVLNPDWWQFQLHDGHWGNVSVEELGGDITVSKSNTEPDAKYFAFTVTDAILAQLTSVQGWGGAFLTNGEGVAITGISMVHFGATETVVWEGDITLSDWTNYDNLGPETLFAEAGLSEGMEVRFYISGGDAEWQIQLFDGHWGGMSFEETGWTNQFNNNNSDLANGYFSFVATTAHVAQLTSVLGWGSFIILQGDGGMHLTKIAIQ